MRNGMKGKEKDEYTFQLDEDFVLFDRSMRKKEEEKLDLKRQHF